ncbi:MAG: hypothetical protein IPP28_06595 [Xanthomonadales bacterium]|nr:hypothetical protein [Xanthomonadales bacterium]
MFDLIAIIAAIVFVVLVLQLRAMLAMPFLKQSARLVPGDWSSLLGAEDVIAVANQEWSTLGFSGPDWLSITPQPVEAANVRAMACWRHESDGTLVFLLPMFLAETPNRCVCYLATRLADGRTLVSQPSDPFFTITATPEEPAQLLAPAPMSDLLAAHGQFVARHGVAAPDAVSDAVLVDLAGRWMNTRRERLIARGALVECSDGIARPRLGFAIRALRAFWSRPKWPTNADPIPPVRLTQIAQTSARIRERAPTATMQALLFLLSVALFMVVGGIVFGWQFAWILLVVIAIHEAGHYLAMRAFGYRNVQMLALPLVGGVTVGHETHPSATHRAWMSLMGPLPGILIGWGLLFVALTQRSEDWVLHSAWIFLAINYLNVVPVPPLDGGHIVQAMLPARWYGLRIAFLASACVAGAVVSLTFGLVGLAVIVLLQLAQLGPLLQNRRAIRHLLAQGGVPVDAVRARKLRLTFDALDQVLGPATRAQARIAQAEDIVRSLDVVPMSLPSRVLTGGVYAVLLAVPLAVAALMLGAGGFSDAAPAANAMTPEELAQQRARAFTDLADAGTEELVASFVRPAWWLRWFLDVPDWPGPADDATIAATEQRIDRALPDELRAFYRLHDGFAMLQLGAVATIAPVPEPPAIDAAMNLLDSPFAVVSAAADGEIALRLGLDDLLACYAISPPLDAGLAQHLPWPSLLWCPRLESSRAAIVNTSTHRAYRDFTLYLRDHAADQQAWRDP